MIKEYSEGRDVICDNCKWAFFTLSSVDKFIKKHNWYVVKDKHYCQTCTGKDGMPKPVEVVTK